VDGELDGEVTVRRLFRSRRQNCISPLGHDGELRMAVSLEKGLMKRKDGDRIILRVDERKYILPSAVSSGRHPDPRARSKTSHMRRVHIPLRFLTPLQRWESKGRAGGRDLQARTTLVAKCLHKVSVAPYNLLWNTAHRHPPRMSLSFLCHLWPF
jgi:hypothetical protein